MKLQNYQKIIGDHLTHSQHSYSDLKEKYGTPLYIIDEESFRDRIVKYKQSLKNDYFETELLFASKSLLTVAIAEIVAEMNIGQDVVSAGEMYTAMKGGVPSSKMYFHGNNKLDDELKYAVDHEIGTIVVDNRNEAQRLERILKEKNRRQKVLLRLNPGIEAHTHEYIMTANLDSKFGESIVDEDIYNIIRFMSESNYIDFAGFHCHIGSQIFDSSSFIKAASEMLTFTKKVQAETGAVIREINFGGGFGVYYTEQDEPFDVTKFLPDFIDHVNKESKALGLELQKVTIEPGRSLINDSGSTLYSVGDLKETVGGKNYLFVDGSMNDNIRPALYQAEYEAALVNKITQPADQVYTIAGKACESGDIIIDRIQLPQAESGDLLLVNGTGAYNFSMASNYNFIPIPGMIHINGASHRMTVQRQSFEDMISNHIIGGQ